MKNHCIIKKELLIKNLKKDIGGIWNKFNKQTIDGLRLKDFLSSKLNKKMKIKYFNVLIKKNKLTSHIIKANNDITETQFYACSDRQDNDRETIFEITRYGKKRIHCHNT